MEKQVKQNGSKVIDPKLAEMVERFQQQAQLPAVVNPPAMPPAMNPMVMMQMMQQMMQQNAAMAQQNYQMLTAIRPQDIRLMAHDVKNGLEDLSAMIGEIVGGSQREERMDKLTQRMQEMHIPEKELWWYLDTRRFGSTPHAGFGLGFERMVLFVTGMGNIRDVIAFPRTPGNAEF